MALSVPHFTFGGSFTPGAFPLTTTAISTTTGNLSVVGIRLNDGGPAITSVTDTAGNTFNPIAGSFIRDNSSNNNTQLYYAINITGNASNVVSVNGTGTPSFSAVCAWEIAGADRSSPLDQVVTGDSATTTVTSSPFTTTSANEIICAIGTGNNGGGQTFAAQSGYTFDGNVGPAGNLNSGAEHLIVSSIQTGVTTSMTASTTAPTVISVATFKQAGSGGGSQVNWVNRHRRFVNKRGY